MSTVRWVWTPPPLLGGVIRQEHPALETFDCESCNGTGQVYRSRFASRTAACDECAGQGRLSIPAEDFAQCRGCGYDQDELTHGGICRACDEAEDDELGRGLPGLRVQR